MSPRIAAAILGGLLACAEPMNPSGGGLSLQLDASAAAWDSVKIFVTGPSNKSMKVTPGTTATIDGLIAGRYTVAIEAFAFGGVVNLFEKTDVDVVANQNASVTPTMADFVSFVPAITGLPSSSTSTSFTVSYSSVTGAASYEVEAATDPAFTANRVAVSSTTTSAQVTVPTFAVYYVRVRAIDAYQGRGQPSPSQTIQLIATAPAAPSALTATAVSNNQINLSWVDNANSEDGFYIERCSGVACSSFAQIATVAANATTYSSSGLASSTSYSYRVRAYNGVGSSASSNTATAVTFTIVTPPAAPSGLTATTASNTQINLSWTDNANNEDVVQIERCTGIGCSIFAQIATVGPNVTTYQSTGLTPSTSYSYRVRANNTAGNSGYSNTATAATAATVVIPAAPTSLTATSVSQAQINLAWTDNADNEDGFRIERCTGACATFTEIATVGPNVTTYSNTGLTASTSYGYRVRAYNSAGNSAYSNTATATTAPTLPVAPSSLTATTVSPSQINLSWADNSNNEDGFQIERCQGASCSSYAQIVTVGPNVTTYQNTGLTAGTSYSYRVRAINATGPSTYSNSATATTTVPPPADPTTLTATAVSSSRIDLAWTDNADNEDGFQIERCTGASCSNFTQVATVAASVTTYSNTGLSASTAYSYRVRAYNAGGNSGYSNTASATTGVSAPAAPTGLGASTASSSQINLSWTDNSNNEDGFQIERCTGVSCSNFAQIATVLANVTVYSSTGLTAGTSYSYRVRANNAGGSSAYSNTATATTTVTPPSADPTDLTATPVSSSQINLSWTDNATNEDGYQIERCTGASCSNFVQIATTGPNVATYSNTTGLSASTAYSYRVRAYNTGGSSGYSNTATATTLIPPPAAPTVLTATGVSTSQINLAWTDNATNEDGYYVERCTGAGCVNFVQIQIVGPNAIGYQDNTGLTAGTTYRYQVRAYNTGGVSGYSNIASGTTLPNPPAPPSALTVTNRGNNSITLGWTNNATNQDGFRIERCMGVNCGNDPANFLQVGTTSNTTFQNTGLSRATTYGYRVVAYNAGGVSTYSNIVYGLTT